MLVAGVLVRLARRASKVNASAVEGILAHSIVKALTDNGICILPGRAMQENLLIYVKSQWFAAVEDLLRLRHDVAIAIKIQVCRTNRNVATRMVLSHGIKSRFVPVLETHVLNAMHRLHFCPSHAGTVFGLVP